MSERTTKESFSQAPTSAESMLSEKMTAYRLNQWVNTDNLSSMKDMQEYFDHRAPGGNHWEIIETEQEDPLKLGLFQGDVFYDKDTEKVFSIDARKQSGEDVLISLSIVSKNGAETKDIVTQDEARKILEGIELIDASSERAVLKETALHQNEDDTRSDKNTEKAPTDYKKLFSDLPDADKQALLDAAYGTGKDKSFAVADFVKSADDAPDSYKHAVEAALRNGFVPKAGEAKTENTTPAPEVTMPDADTDYKDLTDEQKAVIVHDVEGSIRNLDRVEYDKKLSEFRDKLIRDGGMKKEEAEEVIKQASKNINSYEPAFNEGRPFTAQSPADTKPTEAIPSQKKGDQGEELTFEQHVARFNEIVASGDDEQLRKLYEDAYRNKKAKGSFEEFRARLDSFDDSQKGTLMREALRNQSEDSSQDTPGRLGRLANRLTGARAGRLGDANERVKGMWGSAKERWANMDNKRAKLVKAAAGISLFATGIAGVWLLKDHSSAMAVHGIMTSTPSAPGVKETAASIATDGPGLNVGPMGAAGREIHSAFDAGSFSYPWDWAKEAVGADNAQNWLHELSDKAAAAGHQVEWHGNGANQWVAIDGNSKSADVITTLRQFAK